MADVSVVIPTYNRRDYLRRALRSCFRGNDGIDVEVVVVDDGSSDGTREFLRGLDCSQVRPIFQEHQGAQPARNAGLREASGDAIRFLDDDDFLYEGSLKSQYDKLVGEALDVVYGNVNCVTDEGDVTREIQMEEAEDMLSGICRRKIYACTPPFLYRAELAKKHEWTEEFEYHGDDAAYALDIASDDPEIGHHPEPVAAWRLHEGERLSDTKGRIAPTEKLQRGFNSTLRAYERRRRNGTSDPSLDEAVANWLWNRSWRMVPFAFDQFRRNYQTIVDRFPEFDPPRSRKLLKGLDHIANPVATEAIVYPLRKGRVYMREWGVLG